MRARSFSAFPLISLAGPSSLPLSVPPSALLVCVTIRMLSTVASQIQPAKHFFFWPMNTQLTDSSPSFLASFYLCGHFFWHLPIPTNRSIHHPSHLLRRLRNSIHHPSHLLHRPRIDQDCLSSHPPPLCGQCWQHLLRKTSGSLSLKKYYYGEKEKKITTKKWRTPILFFITLCVITVL